MSDNLICNVNAVRVRKRQENVVEHRPVWFCFSVFFSLRSINLLRKTTAQQLYSTFTALFSRKFMHPFLPEMLVRYHSRFSVSDSKAVALHSVDRIEIKLFVMLNEVERPLFSYTAYDVHAKTKNNTFKCRWFWCCCCYCWRFDMNIRQSHTHTQHLLIEGDSNTICVCTPLTLI